MVDCFQLNLINSDLWSTVVFQRCSLVEDFRLFQADLESEELGSLCKARCYMLEGSLGVSDKGNVVSK